MGRVGLIIPPPARHHCRHPVPPSRGDGAGRIGHGLGTVQLCVSRMEKGKSPIPGSIRLMKNGIEPDGPNSVPDRQRCRMKKLFKHMMFFGLLLLAVPPSVVRSASPPMEKVTLQLSWFHQFQFAGYYAAGHRGYYRQAGLDVTFKQARVGMAVTDEVVSGRAEYGIGVTSLLLDRSAGKPVVVLAALFQHSPLILLSRADAGIASPQDLPGRRVMIRSQDDAQTLAVIINEGIPLSDVVLVEHTFDYNDLIEGRVDVATAFLTVQPFLLQQQGVSPSYLRPQTYGIDFYGDCLFTSGKEISRHPDRVRAFRTASLSGWAYAMAHPEEIIDLIRRDYPDAPSREQLLYEARAMEEIVVANLVEPGHMNPGRWRHIADTYARHGMLPEAYSLDGFLHIPGGEPDGEWIKRIRIILPAALVAITLLFLLNSRLKAMVRRRTGELSAANQKLLGVIDERTKAKAELLQLNEELENRIRERTEAFRRAKERAEVANRAKGTFLANMSHELRTPLNSIIGYANILTERGKDNPDLVSGLNIIRQSGEHLLTLINDILVLSKSEAGKPSLSPTWVDLSAFLSTVVMAMQSRSQAKNLPLTVKAPAPLPGAVLADEKRLRQVLLNLLENAVSFTEKGRILLTVELLEGGEPSGGLFRFQVRDTGMGIPPEHLETVFLPFEQGAAENASKEGTGLGLAISSQIVRMMGSRLMVESRVGVGSTFWFDLRLPVSESRRIEESSAHGNITGFKGPSPTILIADDMQHNRLMLQEMLEQVGFTTITVSNGKQAHDTALSRSPDLILMDLLMPVMSGMEAIEEIRRDSANDSMVIIAVSAGILGMEEEKSRVAGADGFISKPIQEGSLLSLLSRHLKIRWTYASADAPPASGEAPRPEESTLGAIPPVEILDRITHDALRGYFTGMERIIKESTSAYPAFAKTLKGYAELFDGDGIINYIKELKEDSHGQERDH